MFKTFSATPADIQQDWYIVDAEGMVLGRLATEVARIIRGKHKPTFTPHMDTGDGVIVINASKVRVTGRKAEQKQYFRHTGYMGHERFTPFQTMIEKHPERVIEKAVYGMLPKTTLGRFDVKANVQGGGQTGQAGALRLAVARALVKLDEAHRRKLRDLGLLTRDARAVERKKPGRPKARKKFQFSKR